jgi:hypothetical protein
MAKLFQSLRAGKKKFAISVYFWNPGVQLLLILGIMVPFWAELDLPLIVVGLVPEDIG